MLSTLFGHHILLIATLAFAAAVLTPNWYHDSERNIHLNVFQICANASSMSSCPWIFTLPSNNSLSTTGKRKATPLDQQPTNDDLILSFFLK